MLRGHVIDDKIVRPSLQRLCLAVPGLERNILSVKLVARNGVVSIFDVNNPRLEANTLTFRHQELGHDLYYLSLIFTDGSNGLEVAMQVAVDTNLWHRL